MSQAVNLAAAMTRIGQEIKTLRQQGSGSSGGSGGGGFTYEEAAAWLLVIQGMIEAHGLDINAVNAIVDAKQVVVTSFPQASDMVPGVLYLRTRAL